MKCFTVSEGLLTEGIGVEEELPLRFVRLGEPGTILTTFAPNPPEIIEGADGSRKIFNAHPVQPRDEKFFALARPNNPSDKHILVRIIGYDSSTILGSTTEIGFGFGVGNGEALGACWYDTMLVLTPETVLMLRPLCGKAHETLSLIYDDGKAKLINGKSFAASMRQEGSFISMEGVDVPDATDESGDSMAELDSEPPEQEYDGGFLIDPPVPKEMGQSVGGYGEF